jgi:DNA-binding transcriptional ArsR family regulator
MTESEAQRMMSALAQAIRLNVALTLSRAGQAGMTSSDIADAVGVPRNLMSSHLAVLSRACVVASVRSGRAVTYRIRNVAIEELADYLRALAASSLTPGRVAEASITPSVQSDDPHAA